MKNYYEPVLKLLMGLAFFIIGAEMLAPAGFTLSLMQSPTFSFLVVVWCCCTYGNLLCIDKHKW